MSVGPTAKALPKLGKLEVMFVQIVPSHLYIKPVVAIMYITPPDAFAKSVTSTLAGNPLFLADQLPALY